MRTSETEKGYIKRYRESVAIKFIDNIVGSITIREILCRRITSIVAIEETQTKFISGFGAVT